ncbi:MAG TPA: FAD-dependent oxidoreductase [Mycobacteriales bacterium]|nr:FAD-dependent oxidoreductase [Mycobacteriales bacterium]
MTQLGIPTSYWIDSTANPSFPQLTEDIAVDVAVIGGGIAGIATAWELVRAGREVVVIEADHLLAATTGNTTAKLSAQHGLIYDRLRSTLGESTSRAYGHDQLDAVEYVAAVADELGIDCDIERRPSISYATDAQQVSAVEAEVEAARASGLPASVVYESPLPYPIAAGVRVEDQIQFHPRKYLLGLVADLVRGGSRVFERSRVVDLSEGSPCRLTTREGAEITAVDVVVATHYPIFDRAGLFSRLTPHRELVVAGPIDPDRDPGGMYITSEDNTRSVRSAPLENGGRLLIVTGESFVPGSAGIAARAQRLAEWAERHFGMRPTYHWAAQDNSTNDGLPYIGSLHLGAEHAYVATGFGGWGMSNGVVAARLLSTLICGGRPDRDQIYDPRRVHPIVEGPGFLRANLANARRFVAGRFGASEVDTPAPGAGAVVGPRGSKCAVYRDSSGQTQVLSASCTHLGCTVAFNDLERTWDCPCHGSRFAVDGSVLQGPATEPLRRLGPDDVGA